jgi:crossover junction endodeoxyribonuclease RuvC
MNTPQVIMGIDPGSNLLGFAFLQIPAKGKPRVIRMGTIDMRKLSSQAEKLAHIFTELQKLIKVYEPNTVGIEAPFYGVNVQSMLKLGRAQGAAMVAVATLGISIEEYSPRSIKRAVTGNGNASKEQVASMLPHIIQGDVDTSSLDASDALGIAFCHYLQSKQGTTGQKKYSNWDAFLKENPGRKR